MKTIIIKYKLVFFILWSLFSFTIALTSSLKDIYLLFALVSFPFSLVSFYIIESFNASSLSIVILAYLGGLVQWVFIGSVMDKFIPKITIVIKNNSLILLNKYLFWLGIFGFILSGLTLHNGYISSIVFNVGLALVLCSIGFKVLFLNEEEKKL